MNVTPHPSDALDATARARILVEALPYIQRFAGRTFVVKYGGHAMENEALKKDFARDIILLKSIGVNVVVVHGGGPQIGEMMGRLGLEPTFVRGLRVTDEATMDVVEMVLAGLINKGIVGVINHLGGRAVGLSGRDGDLLRCRKMTVSRENPLTGTPEILDPGRVGEVIAVDTKVLSTLERDGFIPVVAPVGVGEDGGAYNVNADYAAGKIAAALRAEKLFLLTDIEGVRGADGRFCSSVDVAQARDLVARKVADGGMIPKLEACIDALSSGCAKAHILDGRVPHSVLLETFTDAGIGTEVVA